MAYSNWLVSTIATLATGHSGYSGHFTWEPSWLPTTLWSFWPLHLAAVLTSHYSLVILATLPGSRPGFPILWPFWPLHLAAVLAGPQDLNHEGKSQKANITSLDTGAMMFVVKTAKLDLFTGLLNMLRKLPLESHSRSLPEVERRILRVTPAT